MPNKLVLVNDLKNKTLEELSAIRKALAQATAKVDKEVLDRLAQVTEKGK